MSHPVSQPPVRRPELQPARETLVDELLTPAAPPLDLKKVVHAVRRHKLLFLLVTGLVTGVAAYKVYTEEPVYSATAVMRLRDTRREITGSFAEPTTTDAQGNTDPVLSQIQLLLSRGVAGAVVDAPDAIALRLRPEGISLDALRGVSIDSAATVDSLLLAFAPRTMTVRAFVPPDPTARASGPREGRIDRTVGYGTPVSVGGVRFAVTRAPPGAERAVLRIVPREAAVDELLGGLRAQPRERTSVIDVEYTANDADLAWRVVNSVVQTFETMSTQRAQEASRRRRIFIEDQLRKNDSALAVAQRALSTFRTREQASNARDRFTTSQEGITALAMRREELDADRRTYRALLDALRTSGATRGDAIAALTAAPGLSGNPVIAQLQGQLAGYQATRDSMTTGPFAAAATNPDVRQLDTLIAATSRKLLAIVQTYMDGLDARIAALDEMVAARSAALTRRAPASEAEEGLLTQEVANMSRLTDQLREEYQKARMAEAVEAGQVEVVDLAAAASQVFGVGRTRKLAFGLVVGILLGVACALLLEHTNTSIRRRSEMESLLLVPGLAVIPQIPGSRQSRTGLLRLPGFRPRTNGNGRATADLLDDGLVTISNFRSSSAEAYRTLRTNLLFSQLTRELKKIVVTSAAPGDGKTTVSANLAVTFSQQGIRVLLIDCDLRRARLHNVFSVPRVPGFSELVVGYADVASAIRETRVENLYVLPAGTLPPNPSELLGGQRVPGLLEQLARDYDVLILDTPPVLAAADAAVLGGLADGVLLVVRAGKTEREAAKDALRQLNTVGAHIVGAVLNDPDANVPQYAGRYYEYWSGPTR
ncbi:MAG TPA: polysaccharide biosynthesis tyrosine autokinase [Gemmatimonadaceae bacterium]|nr:polysaccharide biosynthesis tyrosine autokinase [Gemmatimonadaceae bacterium]